MPDASSDDSAQARDERRPPRAAGRSLSREPGAAAPAAEEPSLRRLALSRTGVLVLAVVTVCSFGARIVAVSGTHRYNRIYVDSVRFLEIAALLEPGRPGLTQVPELVSEPLYGVMIHYAQYLMPDWLMAARVVALVSAALAGPVLCLFAWWLDRTMLTGLLAGLMYALSQPLVVIGAISYSDCPFLLFLALGLWALLAFVRAMTVWRAALAALGFGLAWATRAAGMLFAVAAMATCFYALVVRLRAPRGAARRASKFQALVAVCVLVAGSAAVGVAPGVWMRRRAEGLRPEYSHAKGALLDGQLFAIGGGHRDQQYFRLNADCTEFVRYDLKDMSWGEFIRRHGAGQLRAAVHNICQNIGEIIPSILQPFAVLFLPLAVGMIRFWQRRPAGEILAFVLFALPVVAVVPLIQMQGRYVLPLALAGFPLAACGLSAIRARAAGETAGRRRFLKALVLLSVVAFVGHGLYETKQVRDRPYTKWAYRDAVEWIRQRHGTAFDFAVMSRWRGPYALLKCENVDPPTDGLERLLRYCRHTNTRYILLGWLELERNKHLREAFADAAEVTVDGGRLTVVARFSRPDEADVRVVEVVQTPATPAGPATRPAADG
jgi:hypothetical protein